MKADLKKVEAIFVDEHLPAKTNYPPFRFISLKLDEIITAIVDVLKDILTLSPHMQICKRWVEAEVS